MNGFQTYSVVVSIPINLSPTEDEELAALEEKGVKARYASVERILELPDDRVEWRMATSSSAGGLVPQFMNNFALPGAISKVVLNVPVHRFVTDDLPTSSGCTSIFEVDANEEGYGRQRDIIRTGPASRFKASRLACFTRPSSMGHCIVLRTEC